MASKALRRLTDLLGHSPAYRCWTSSSLCMMSSAAVERASSPDAKRPRIEAKDGPSRKQLPAEAVAGPSKPRATERKRKIRRLLPDPYSAQDVMWHDVRDFLGHDYVYEAIAKGVEWDPPIALFDTLEVRVGVFTVSGESLALVERDGRKWALLVPFAHPGDLVRCKVFKHDRLHSTADLIQTLEYNEADRGGQGDRRKYPDQGCRYFGECSGCQLQPIPYELQLAHKHRTVQLAYDRFSGLTASAVPPIQPTIGSPKQWGYRTKITPHFGAPPPWLKTKMSEEGAMNSLDGEFEQDGRSWACAIGFERKGKPGVMDIEECPIATAVLNEKMVEERARVKSTISSYSRGSTLLLRDSLRPPDDPTLPLTTSSISDQHVAVIDHKATIYERVGDLVFTFAANSFFQNNNSILGPLTTYVKEAIFPPITKPTSNGHADGNLGNGHAEESVTVPSYLVDTYCGSGLFAISLAANFEEVAGVEISPDSITAAKRNAELNNVKNVDWVCAKAEEIFGGLGDPFVGEKSCVIVDPPRKGCDIPFLEQLLAFRPVTIVYVSCNVHTQARDIGWMIKQSEEGDKTGSKYKLESLRGFDLFPQTAHVESVAVLRLDPSESDTS